MTQSLAVSLEEDAAEDDMSQNFLKAVKEGDEALVDKFMRDGANIKKIYNDPDGQRLSLLSVAAYYDRKNLVKKFLSLGLEAEGPPGSHLTPLMMAAKKGHTAVLDLLIQGEANVHAKSKNEEGNTPLHYAAERGQVDCVKNLIKMTSKNVTNKLGQTPVHSACQGKHMTVLRIFKDEGWDFHTRDNKGCTALHVACSVTGNEELIKFLVEAGLKMTEKNNDDYTPVEHALVSAVDKGNLRLLKQVLSQEHNIQINVKHNDESWCLLTLAANHGHANLIRTLVDSGLDIEGRNGKAADTPLMVAAKKGHTEVVQELLNADADPQTRARGERGDTAMHYAASLGHLECVKLLMNKVDKNIMNKRGHTPVHSASQGNHTNVLELLYQEEWDFTKKNKQDRTALHHAAHAGAVEAVKYLVNEAGLNVEEVDGEGLAPIDGARMKGRHEVEQWLMKNSDYKGATHHELMKTMITNNKKSFNECTQHIMNKKLDDLATMLVRSDGHLINEAGETLLHIASKLGMANAVQRLLDDKHIHPHVVNFNDETPADLARDNKHQDVLQVLSTFQSNQGPEAEDERLSKEKKAELYSEMMRAIVAKDDVVEVSKLLLQGAPVAPVGNTSVHALQLAIICGRPKVVGLLLAAGAPLTPSHNNYNLLELAFFSSNKTPGTLAHILLHFKYTLEKESYKVSGNRRLLDGINHIIDTLDSEEPWKARWPQGESEVGLTELLVMAASDNCLLTAAFLVKAGAWPYYCGEAKKTALHEAIDCGHLRMAERLVKDLNGCLYRQPSQKNEEQLHKYTEFIEKLEEELFEKEKQKLEDIIRRHKCEKEKIETAKVLNLQKKLSDQKTPLPVDDQQKTLGSYALMLASQVGLQQMIHRLLYIAKVKIDTVVDPVTGTTALHHAAAYGKADCVELLISKGANVLQQDRYGHTPAHLAAMFGYTETYHLLAQHTKKYPNCRAGTSAQQIFHNFHIYKHMYWKCGDDKRDIIIPHEEEDTWNRSDRREEDIATQKVLEAIDPHELVKEPRRVKVDFSCGEAKKIKDVVTKELTGILNKVAEQEPFYKGKLELVGSSGDNTKLYCPDEYDFNLTLTAEKNVGITLENPGQEDRIKGVKKVVKVSSSHKCLTGDNFISTLWDTINKCLKKNKLQDERLSFVPPGLYRTQVGVALCMAWQGHQYPLLLVGVDLAPVLAVDWDTVKIDRPKLTPEDFTTLNLSNCGDGSWRCNFAQAEKQVLQHMKSEQRQVYLIAKILLTCMKPEKWMPRELRVFYTYWADRRFQIPVPSGFCLKNAFLRLLAKKTKWEDEDTLALVCKVFEEMCEKQAIPNSENTCKASLAYFGGHCEGHHIGYGAPNIVKFLESLTSGY